jgi:Zn-dependent protease
MDQLGDQFGARIYQMAIQFVPFVMAVVFHEFAHGFVANQWGDPSAKDEGRLTLNPVPHLDPIGTLLFPMINMLSGMNLLFGWARPVPINPNRFRKYRPGLFWVSFAGPGMNFLLGILSGIAFAAISAYASPDFYLKEPLQLMAIASVGTNYALGIFNLIPLPPLDGSKLVEAFLPFDLARKYESLAQYSFFILMGLLLTGAFRILEGPIRFCSHLTIGLAAQLFHL